MLYARVLYRTLYVYPTGQFRRRSVLWLATSPEQVARARRRPLRLVGEMLRSGEPPPYYRAPPPTPAALPIALTRPKRPMAATDAAIQNTMQQLSLRRRGSA